MDLMNELRMTISGKHENESFVRNTVCAFCSELNPTVSEIEDIKTSVSEAYTNCIVHAYEGRNDGDVEVVVQLYDKLITIIIKDNGVGISDVEKAMEPFFTTKPADDRSGIGFTLIQTFMTSLDVSSDERGTVVMMTKAISG